MSEPAHTLSSQSPLNEASTGREKGIYTSRFTAEEDAVRRVTWRVLSESYFQQFIKPTDTVLDIGAGDGNFIRHIRAARRIAADVSAHVNALSTEGIEVLQLPAHRLSTKLSNEIDVAFMSNFLEHLPTKQLVFDVLDECRRVLKPSGILLVLQPNIRYTGVAYWDYIDHHIALTEHSLVEALNVSGFAVERIVPRFLPYTAKSKVGHLLRYGDAWTEIMVRTYLRFPLLWRFFGQQTFIVARPL